MTNISFKNIRIFFVYPKKWLSFFFFVKNMFLYKIVRFVMQIMLDISKNFETYVNGVMKLIYCFHFLMKIHTSIIIVFYWEYLSYFFTLPRYAAKFN